MPLYFATGNPGKVDDARTILGDADVAVEQVDVAVVEPQDASIEDIARFKVEQALEQTQLHDAYVMADDSGLFVDALDGFPGPLSSPFDATAGKERLLDLAGEGASARFRAAVAVHDPGESDISVFTGACEGTLVEPRGDDGFGYDPLFLPDGHDRTFAEDTAYKHQVSHRKEALKKVRDWLQERPSTVK